MNLSLRPYLRTSLIRWALGLSLFAWAATSSIYALRARPRVVLIGLDAYGTRIIEAQGDPLITQERLKLVKEFLYRFYNYDGSTYDRRVSQAGEFMADALWKEKEEAFKQIGLKMKTQPIRQETRLLDLREVNEQEFEADLAIHVVDRLISRDVKYRVSITVGPRKRDAEHPYAWEVKEYHEDELR